MWPPYYYYVFCKSKCADCDLIFNQLDVQWLQENEYSYFHFLVSSCWFSANYEAMRISFATHFVVTHSSLLMLKLVLMLV